jgi:NTP pyrophosphatase (non-canonical NTP hydrolase)
MNFSEYQTQALNTDQIPAVEGSELIIPLLGLVGEVGSLMTEYKKHLRDGDAHKLFEEGIAEELGDMLWYISNIASKFNLDLQEIAEANLSKCNDRWGEIQQKKIIKIQVISLMMTFMKMKVYQENLK